MVLRDFFEDYRAGLFNEMNRSMGVGFRRAVLSALQLCDAEGGSDLTFRKLLVVMFPFANERDLESMCQLAYPDGCPKEEESRSQLFSLASCHSSMSNSVATQYDLQEIVALPRVS
jgi:hypothetical protein